MADPVKLVTDIFNTGRKLKKALDTIRMNEVDCQELLEQAAILSPVLSCLQNNGLMSHPMMFPEALEGIHSSLDRALKEVTQWQERRFVHRLFTASEMAKQLQRVHSYIQGKIALANIAISVSNILVTVELTLPNNRIRYGGALPPPLQLQQVAAEVETYSSNSTAGDAGSIEDINEVPTNEVSSAPSSRLTEFSHSEAVAMHDVSEENNNISSSMVYKFRILIKVDLTCKKCYSKVMGAVRAYGEVVTGLDDIEIDQQRNMLVLAGNTLDIDEGVRFLQRKLHHKPAFRCCSSVIQDITTQIFGSMRPRPRNTTNKAELSSSPQFIIEGMGIPARAPTTGSEPPIFLRESSSSITFGQYPEQEHACTSASRATAGDLFDKPDQLLLEHQPAAPDLDDIMIHDIPDEDKARDGERAGTLSRDAESAAAAVETSGQQRIIVASKTKEEKEAKRPKKGARVETTMQQYQERTTKKTEAEASRLPHVKVDDQGSEFSIKRCITVLDGMEISKQEKAKAYSVFIKSKGNREAFISGCEVDPETALMWLKSEIA